TPTTVGTDVEAAPVVDRSHDWGWCLGIRTGGQISSRGGSRHPQSKPTKRTQQGLLHRNFSIPVICDHRLNSRDCTGVATQSPCLRAGLKKKLSDFSQL